MSGAGRPGRRMGRGGWWRRNRLALIACAVLLPATFGIIGWNEWSTAFAGWRTAAFEAEAGRAVDFGGASWGPATVAEVAPSAEFDVPQGAELIEVTVPVVPGGEEPSCFPPVLRETGGAQREWKHGGYLFLGWDDTSCSLMGSEPFELVVPYLIPSDAEGPFVVELEVLSETRLLRLPLGD